MAEMLETGKHKFALVLTVKYTLLMSLVLHITSYKCVSSFYSPKELEIYNVLLKPYGVNLTGVISSDVIASIPPHLWNCTGHSAILKTCNTSSVNLASKTTAKEFSSLKSLQRNCPRGGFNCFRNQLISDKGLQKWLGRLNDGMKNLCKNKCWKTLDLVSGTCLRSEMPGMKEADRNSIQLVNQVLESLCVVEDKSSCAERFISGLLNKLSSNNSEVCNVTESIEGTSSGCSKTCYMELKEFHNALGCCVGSMNNVMKCHSIKPQGKSFGVLLMEKRSQCHLPALSACKQGPKECTLATQASPTSTPTESGSAKRIAGICLAVIICIGGVIILGSYFYRRMKRREKLRFEDYGYSRLKMMEDDFYYDVEDEDAGEFVTL